MSQYCSPHFEITICDSILRRDFELILQLMSPFDALEASLDTLRVASNRVFRGTAPLGAYHRNSAVDDDTADADLWRALGDA